MPGFVLTDPLLPRPGVYLIQHLISGKTYVGISQNVLKRYKFHSCFSSPKKLKNALKKHGLDTFSFTALYYSIDGYTTNLPALEADLIALYGSLGEGGYNVKQADGGVGPYGPEHAALVRAALKRPETVERNRLAALARYETIVAAFNKARPATLAKLAELWTDAEFRERFSAAAREGQRRPETKAKIASSNARPERKAQRKEIAVRLFGAKSEKLHAAAQTPSAKAKRKQTLVDFYQTDIGRQMAIDQHADPAYRAIHAAAYLRPEVLAKMSAAKVGCRWINDGRVIRMLRPGETLSVGWRYGRVLNEGPLFDASS